MLSLVVCIMIDDLYQFAFIIIFIYYGCLHVPRLCSIPWRVYPARENKKHKHIVSSIYCVIYYFCYLVLHAVMQHVLHSFPTISSIPIHIITVTYLIVYWFLPLLMDIICSVLTSICIYDCMCTFTWLYLYIEAKCLIYCYFWEHTRRRRTFIFWPQRCGRCFFLLI
jgi:hypothetical protein